MPWVDIPAGNDYVSLWYLTNSPYGNVGSFDPQKPTIIMLHPLFLDSLWLKSQFDDPRLASNYNMIGFDMRCCGKSRYRPSGLHDSWVDAADLAFACQLLYLPSAHVLALENLSVNCALRFVTLFPEMCLSLTCCNIPPPTELKWVFHAYDEMLRLWCFAEDLDSFEHAAMEVVTFMTGKDSDPDLRDEIVAYWEKTYPPPKRLRVAEMINVIMNRTPLSLDTLATITMPVLIIQGEHSMVAPLSYAEDLKSALVSVPGGAHLYVIKGATACLTVVPSTSSIVNQVLVKFLARLPHARSDLIPPRKSLDARMTQALTRLSEISGNSSVASRDSNSPLSFSLVSPDVEELQMESLRFFAQGLEDAYCPLGSDGRPVRKFSERVEQHWFHGDSDGLSVANSELALAHMQHRSESPDLPSSVSAVPSTYEAEPISLEVAQDGRMRRTTFTPSHVDRHVVKGTMSKIVSSTGLSIPKILLPSA